MRAAGRHYSRLRVLKRRPALVDVVVPLLVTAVIIAGAVAASGGVRVVPLVLGCAAGLSLFARRRAPAATLAVSGALTIVVLHLEPSAGATTVIVPAVALYSVAVRSGTRARVIAAAAAVAAIVVADRLHNGAPSLAQTLGHVLLVAIPLLIADVHRARHANVALLRERYAILSKPGKLTDEEYARMQAHSVLGYEIVSAADLPTEATWVRHHHERYVGRGYPDGLAGEAIPLESRIIFVADAFEAMSSDRPYRNAPGEKYALVELRRHAGTQFDRHIVDALIHALARPAQAGPAAVTERAA